MTVERELNQAYADHKRRATTEALIHAALSVYDKRWDSLALEDAVWKVKKAAAAYRAEHGSSGVPARVEMTPARLSECAEIIGWSWNRLAQKAQVNERTVRRWASGEYAVPEDVAAWLERLAAAHEANPIPRKGDQ